MPHIPKRAVQPGPQPSPVSHTEGVRRELLATQPRKKMEIKKVEPPIRKAGQMLDKVSPWSYDVDPDEVMESLFPNGITSNG